MALSLWNGVRYDKIARDPLFQSTASISFTRILVAALPIIPEAVADIARAGPITGTNPTARDPIAQVSQGEYSGSFFAMHGRQATTITQTITSR